MYVSVVLPINFFNPWAALRFAGVGDVDFELSLVSGLALDWGRMQVVANARDGKLEIAFRAFGKGLEIVFLVELCTYLRS